jgi:hypothetical protein
MIKNQIELDIQNAIDESILRDRIVPVVVETDKGIEWVLTFINYDEFDYVRENDGTYDVWGESIGRGSWRICVSV